MRNRKRNRLKGYDYSRDNLYFITICVQDMICCFGDVVQEIAGNLHDQDVSAKNQDSLISEKWNRIESNRCKMRMELNEYGLLVKNQINWLEAQYPYVVVHNFVVMPNHVHAIIEIDSLKVAHLSVKIKSLSSLVGAFKTTSSKMIHIAGLKDFAWKRSFHDHIIRNQRSYENISNYIDLNPQRWHQDGFFSES